MSNQNGSNVYVANVRGVLQNLRKREESGKRFSDYKERIFKCADGIYAVNLKDSTVVQYQGLHKTEFRIWGYEGTVGRNRMQKVDGVWYVSLVIWKKGSDFYADGEEKTIRIGIEEVDWEWWNKYKTWSWKKLN